MNVKQVLMEHIQSEFMVDNPGAKLEHDTQIIDQGIIDSLGIFLLVDFIQERFGIAVEPDEIVIENFESVDAIAALVESK